MAVSKSSHADRQQFALARYKPSPSPTHPIMSRLANKFVPVFTKANFARSLYKCEMARVFAPLATNIVPDGLPEKCLPSEKCFEAASRPLAQKFNILSAFIDVLATNDACPPSTTLSPKVLQSSDSSEVYVAFGSAECGQDSGQAAESRPYFLVCNYPEVYAGKTASTYSAALHWLPYGATLPDWVVSRNSSSKQPVNGGLYLMDKDLACNLCCNHFDIHNNPRVRTQRVYVKLPRTTTAFWGSTHQAHIVAQVTHLQRVLEKFAQERRAEAHVSPPLHHVAPGADNPTASASLSLPHDENGLAERRKQCHVAPRRLFGVRLTLLRALHEHVPTVDSMRQIFDQEYPVMQDYGPSLDLIRAALKAIAKAGWDGTNWTKHPDLRAIVEMLVADESGSSPQAILCDLDAQARARLASIHALNASHGSVASRNICVGLKRKDKSSQNESQSSLAGNFSLQVQFIDCANSNTVDDFIHHYKDVNKSQKKLTKQMTAEQESLGFVMCKLQRAVAKARSSSPVPCLTCAS